MCLALSGHCLFSFSAGAFVCGMKLRPHQQRTSPTIPQKFPQALLPEPLPFVYIRMVGTGHELPELPANWEREYISTAQIEDGSLVFHFYLERMK